MMRCKLLILVTFKPTAYTKIGPLMTRIGFFQEGPAYLAASILKDKTDIVQ
jgi:hypothetical protein